MSNGHDTMQNLHPMHLSPSHVTGPSRVLTMALTRQADAHAGCQQCMHCFLTKTSPLLVLKRFTIVNCFSVVSRTFSNALSLMTSGTKLALVSEQETSQARQPMHRVVSTSTPTNSLSSSVFAALADLAGSTGMTAVAAVRKKHLLSMLSPDSQARAIS